MISLKGIVQSLKLTEIQPDKPLSETTGGSRIFGTAIQKIAPKFTFSMESLDFYMMSLKCIVQSLKLTDDETPEPFTETTGGSYFFPSKWVKMLQHLHFSMELLQTLCDEP